MKRTDNSKRTIIFVASLGSGGAERVAVRVSGWLRDVGHDVCLLTLSSANTDFYACPDGVRRIGLNLLGPSRGLLAALAANVRRMQAVRRAVTGHRAAAVVSLGDRSNVLMLMATLGLGCRKIISERADPRLQPLSRGWAFLRRLVYPFAALHVSQSTYATDWIAQRFPSLPCRLIGNASDLQPSAPPELRRAVDEPVQLITVGRLTRQKGIDLLLEALAQARHRCRVALELAIIGEGEDRAVLQSRAVELGISAVVRFDGRVGDVRERLQSADFFVLPSRWEGFPNAMIEAMSVGLPVVVARCRGGVEDILGEEAQKYALEFPPEDVAALANRIVRLAEDAALRRRLGMQALVRAADFSPARIAAAWREVVEQP